MRSLGRQERAKTRPPRTAACVARGGRGAERALPEPFAGWFADRGWAPRPHQLALLDAAAQRRSTLLIAPTGAGKTLAGFLPSLVEPCAATARQRRQGPRPAHALHLAAEGAGGRRRPQPRWRRSREMEPADPHRDAHRRHARRRKRQRQRVQPPDILLTTPEQLALLLQPPRRAHLFADLDTVILDELHALAPTKRGDLLALDLARLRTLAPDLDASGSRRRWRAPCELRAYLVPPARRQPAHRDGRSRARRGRRQAGRSRILDIDEPVPWAGHTTRYAVARDLRRRSSAHRLTPGLRQHAHPGRAAVPGAVAHQRRRACRSRCTTARSTPSSGARSRRRWPRARCGRGLHLDARPRHRLGRRRPRHPCRRAQGREPPDPAHRPRQPPARRALAGASWCRPTASRCWSAAPRSMRPRPASRTRVPSRSGALDVLAQHVLGTACAGAVRARRALCARSYRPRPTPTSRAPTSTASSTSSPPAATRSRPTSASPS